MFVWNFTSLTTLLVGSDTAINKLLPDFLIGRNFNFSIILTSISEGI